MKIIHLISGGDVGGAKTHVLSLVQGLGKTQSVRLVCFTDGEFADDARKMGIDTQILSGGVRQTLHALCEMITSEGYEIVHCHGSRANMFGAILRRRLRVPTVTTVHSDYRLDYLGRPFHRLTYGTINTVALRKFDYHIGVSDATAQLLISRGFDPQTMYSIYNGLDFTPTEPPLCREEYCKSIGLSADDDSVIFGIAARLSAVKDIGTLIRSFSEAAKTHPYIRLAIAGDGELRQELESLAQNVCPPGTCVFAGWVSDMDSFYNALDVNMLTSLSEGFPYALVEGARKHCATIATSVGGVPYLIEHGVTGLLFTPKDEKTLTAHICQLADNPALRVQLAESLFERASEKCSLEATVGRQLHIYESILRRERAPEQKRSGVMICGAYGKGNAGDEAILKSILAQLRNIDEDMPVCVLSHDPKQTRLRYHVDSVHTFDPLAYLPKMRKTKLYISGGGTLIQDQTSTRSLKYYLMNIRQAHDAGCKVLMYGCGIGPVSPKNRRHAARVIDRCVDEIALREDLSAEELKSLGVRRPKIHVTADPALLLAPGSERAVDSFLLGCGLDPAGAYALFVLRPWKGFERKKQVFTDASNYVNQKYGLTPVFFALEPERDLPPSRAVAESVGCAYHILPTPQDERYIIGMMRKMRLVVSMRLHTLIFASGVGTPLVGVSYDPKVSGFMRYIGQKHCVEFDDVTTENLCTLIDDALSQKEPCDVAHLRALAAENEAIARRLLEEPE